MQAVERWPPLPLAVASMATNAGFSCIALLLWAIPTAVRGGGIGAVWRGYENGRSWAILLSTAIGPWGVGTVFQMMAQQRLSPSHTQILLAFSPVCATLLAHVGFLVPKERELSPLALLGMGIILCATVVPPIASICGRS
jgi:drug/metabolite transporter (DMT)-like permease